MIAPNSIKRIEKLDSSYLDFFRGLSAQLVLIGHLLNVYGVMKIYKIPKIQNFGVMVFFILSGFLISQTSFIKSKAYGFKNYIIDRFSRIYIAFLPALILILVLDLIFIKIGYNVRGSFDYSFNSFLCNSFLIHSHPYLKDYGIASFGSARPFWTISIEWLYYLFFGSIFYFSVKKNSLLSVVSLLLLFLFTGIAVVYYFGGRGDGLSYYWLFGFVIAVMYNYKFYLQNLFVGTFLVIITIIAMGYRYIQCNSTDVYDVVFGALLTLLLFLLMKSNNIFNYIIRINVLSKFSFFLASFSFSLYLIHFTLIFFFEQFLKFNNIWIEIVFLFFIINILAFLFYLVFEKRHVKFRNNLKRALKLK